MKEALHSKDEGQNPPQIVKGTVYVDRLRVGGGDWVKQSRIRSLYAVEFKTTWEGQDCLERLENVPIHCTPPPSPLIGIPWPA